MLKDRFTYVEEVKAAAGDGWFAVPADKLPEVAEYLRDEEKFDVLSCLTGTDRGDSFEAVYHIFSVSKRETVILKVKLEKGAPRIPSIANIFASADWMEREAFDLLGIEFTGHQNPKRILLPDDWTGHPLRKDYKEEAEYCGMSTVR